MIFENIDFHNVDEITNENGEYAFHRFPVSLEDKLTEQDGSYWNRRNIGIELRFVMKSDTVRLKFRAAEDSKIVPVSIAVGDLYYGSDYITDKETEIVLDKNKLDTMNCNAKMYERGETQFDISVIRIYFQSGCVHFLGVEGDVEPPAADMLPKTKIYAYGSSITSAAGSRIYDLGYCPLTAKNLGYDLINKGMPGSCCLQKEIADYIAEQDFDLGIFELGVNILSVGGEKDFGERLDYFLKTAVGAHEDKKIFLISPFFMWDDFDEGKPAELYRKEFVKVLSNYDFKNAVYIDGLTLFNEPKHLQTDTVHPDVFGHLLIAERLTKIIKESL